MNDGPAAGTLTQYVKEELERRAKNPAPAPNTGKWIPQVKGDPNGKSWEISVVRENNTHGRASWGWFDENKILISHNGGHCSWPLGYRLGEFMAKLAETYAEMLNNNDPTLMYFFQYPLYEPKDRS